MIYFNKELIFFIKLKKKNIFINLIDKYKNKLLKTYSFGNIGFNNKKKNTPFALQTLILKIIKYSLDLNYTNINIIINGNIYLNRTLLLTTILNTSIKNKKLNILSIKDLTSFPFNGCRFKNKPKK
uniref:30S ribosomal protein S11 n=1 Tax=Nephromyces sp. ex Molgula occidentalis TaxID=2544991 RepID=A0A5C1H7G5_9APIC|nr:30S ribosomal protein S11 [Nephromyces sp. ex Molgula occidentalis]